jgi:hypothetical protein
MTVKWMLTTRLRYVQLVLNFDCVVRVLARKGRFRGRHPGCVSILPLSEYPL